MSKIEEHRLYVLHRNYLWSNLLREQYYTFDDEFDEKGEEIQEEVSFQRHAIESYLYMSLWFSLLYVVVEGWEQLKLHDKNVNKLLESENRDLLRRYRNATFHYHEVNYDPRVTRVMGDPEVTHWAEQLHVAFGMYFKDIFGKYTDNTLFPKNLGQDLVDRSLEQMLEQMQLMSKVISPETKLTCPNCKKVTTTRIYIYSPQTYKTRCCGVILKPVKGECCVFCSYGDIKCGKQQMAALKKDSEKK